MSEKGSSPRPQGGAGEHISQNYGRLKNMPEDELLFEFEAKMDGMTDLDYDGELMDTYLAALDEKAPLDPDPDAEASWNEFRTKHADLFERDVEDENGSTKDNVRKVRLRKLLPKIVAIVAVAALFIALCAQAAGFNFFGMLGKWTGEIFGFLSADGGSGTDGSDFEAKDDNTETYLLIKLALTNCGITEDIVPKWYPEGFEAKPPEIQSVRTGDIIYCYFTNNNDKYLGIKITRYNEPGNVATFSLEKDGLDVEEYVSKDRLFYILSNLENTTVTWSDGETLTMTVSSNISLDEVKKIIDSIGG